MDGIELERNKEIQIDCPAYNALIAVYLAVGKLLRYILGSWKIVA